MKKKNLLSGKLSLRKEKVILLSDASMSLLYGGEDKKTKDTNDPKAPEPKNTTTIINPSGNDCTTVLPTK